MSVHAFAQAIRRSKALTIVVALLILGAMALVSVIPVDRTREHNLREQVTRRLMQIEMAKQELALREDLKPGTELTMEELVAESQFLAEAPVSSFGQYEVGAVDELPRFVRPDGPALVPQAVWQQTPTNPPESAADAPPDDRKDEAD